MDNSKKLTMWFNNWGHDLVQLGFATKLNDDGDIHIPDDQLGRIINFDETCLSLDGSGNRGGRPEVVFFNPLLLHQFCNLTVVELDYFVGTIDIQGR